MARRFRHRPRRRAHGCHAGLVTGLLFWSVLGIATGAVYNRLFRVAA